jgi:hypothetical protein
MPRPKFKLTQRETLEYRSQLRELRELGLDVGPADDFSKRREQLRLEQVDDELASIHALPGTGFIFVARVRQTVLASNFLVDGFEATAAWDHSRLDLDEPETFPLYRDITADFYPAPVTLLNPWLIGERPLRRSQKVGLIIARGRTSLPAGCTGHAVLGINVSLWDEKENEAHFEFQARVDLSLRIGFERWLQQRNRPERGRQPIFGPKYHGRSKNRVSQTPTRIYRLPDKNDTQDRSYNDIHSTDEIKRWRAMLNAAMTNSLPNLDSVDNLGQQV